MACVKRRRLKPPDADLAHGTAGERATFACTSIGMLDAPTVAHVDDEHIT